MAVLTGEYLASLPVLRAQLRAAGAARSLRRAGVQELALRLGALRMAGVAPMLARRPPKPVGRAGEAGGGIAPLAPMRRAAARGAALAAAGAAETAGGDGFRAVLAAARRAAAQARARRAQSRAEAFLPGRSVGMPRAGFAPVQGGPMVPAGVLRPRRLAVTEERLTPSPEVITPALGGGRREAHMAAALAAVPRQGAAPAVMPAAPMAGGGSRPEPVVDERDLAQALRAYFFRQSRLPPAGAAGFDPRLTPAWAGVKIPG